MNNNLANSICSDLEQCEEAEKTELPLQGPWMGHHDYYDNGYKDDASGYKDDTSSIAMTNSSEITRPPPLPDEDDREDLIDSMNCREDEKKRIRDQAADLLEQCSRLSRRSRTRPPDPTPSSSLKPPPPDNMDCKPTSCLKPPSFNMPVKNSSTPPVKPTYTTAPRPVDNRPLKEIVTETENNFDCELQGLRNEFPHDPYFSDEYEEESYEDDSSKDDCSCSNRTNSSVSSLTTFDCDKVLHCLKKHRRSKGKCYKKCQTIKRYFDSQGCSDVIECHPY